MWVDFWPQDLTGDFQSCDKYCSLAQIDQAPCDALLIHVGNHRGGIPGGHHLDRILHAESEFRPLSIQVRIQMVKRVRSVFLVAFPLDVVL